MTTIEAILTKAKARYQRMRRTDRPPLNGPSPLADLCTVDEVITLASAGFRLRLSRNMIAWFKESSRKGGSRV